MASCLVALGSNLGDRPTTLARALEAIDRTAGLALQRQSSFHETAPLGGVPNQGEFLNACVVVEASIPPEDVLASLQRIEADFGRQRSERWAARTLDLDLLLYGDAVMKSDALELPHPRMSFRRFVLAPAVEIAGQIVHPTIGWTLAALLDHLNTGADCVAILSPLDSLRLEVAAALEEQFRGREFAGPELSDAEQLWPTPLTTWVEFGDCDKREVDFSTRAGSPATAAVALSSDAPPTARFPKLSLLLDAGSADLPAVISGWTEPADAIGISVGEADLWAAAIGSRGRGPTLHVRSGKDARLLPEVFAAVQSIWPDLGHRDAARVE